jgi:hypothetical protein
VLLDRAAATDLLRAAVQQISGLAYARLICVFSLLAERAEGFARELTVLNILWSASRHRLDFHHLMANPMNTLLSAVTYDNVLDLLPLCDVLGISHDQVLLDLMLNHMKSDRYEEYESLISRFRSPQNIQTLIDLLPKAFPSSARAKLYEAVGRSEDQQHQLLIHDLQQHGLTELSKPEFLNNPAHLLTELYSRPSFQEAFGGRIHGIAERIACQYNLSLARIRADLVSRWLLAIEPPVTVEDDSVFGEVIEDAVQKTDSAVIQRALFLLRAWDPPEALAWLFEFLEREIAYRAKARAFACLFALADESAIRSAYKKSFADLICSHREAYFGSRLEIFGLSLNVADFSEQNAAATLARCSTQPLPHPGVGRLLFELALLFAVDDRLALLRVLSGLLATRKRFLLRSIGSLFAAFPEYASDPSFRDLYLSAVSAPLDELITQSDRVRHMQTNHNATVRDLLDAIGAAPFPVECWRIGREALSWEEVAGLLCARGFPATAAEFGSMAAGAHRRAAILRHLLRGGHFDDAIKFGFDRDAIFEFIVAEDRHEAATQVLIDEHFAAFVRWLADRGRAQSLETVTAALRRQGRTVEAKRVAEQFAPRAGDARSWLAERAPSG